MIGEFTVTKKKDSNAEFTGNLTITHTSTGQMIHHCGVTLSEQHAAILSQHINTAHNSMDDHHTCLLFDMSMIRLHN